MSTEALFCLSCGTGLQRQSSMEDGGPKECLRCPACGWTHWNNPTPVLAAVIECSDRDAQLLLARNAAWPGWSRTAVLGAACAPLESGP